jgi:hypothetical protein
MTGRPAEHPEKTQDQGKNDTRRLYLTCIGQQLIERDTFSRYGHEHHYTDWLVGAGRVVLTWHGQSAWVDEGRHGQSAR